MIDNVLSVKQLTKVYKLYKKPADRIKEALNIFSKQEYFTEKYALKNISFQLKKGETLAIIGKNGSGKSTLLKIIAGVLTPSMGEISVNGKITSLIELGAGFNPEFTGIENIFFNGTIYGFSEEEIRGKLDNIIEFADIGNYIHQPVKTYSSGMFARLAFSLMIHMEPDILIVDEALSVGDVFFQQKCNTYMKNDMKEVTKIIVTHDMTSVANLADRCIVISEGKKVFDGDTLDGIEFYIKKLHSESFAYIASNSNDIDRSIVVDSKAEYTNIVSIDSLGGALKARIKSFDVLVNNTPYKGYIMANDRVDIKFFVDSDGNIENTIFGYIISDKFGNQVFGENTITSLKTMYCLPNGRSSVTLSFYWPEVKEGYYFLTLGIGEGEHELQHVIQCWAHNIFEFSNVTPHKTIHCLFNNEIKELNIL